MGQFGSGQSVRRIEDERFLTGKGRFADDHQHEDMLHLAFVRSPHAHARLISVDIGKAQSMPGVVKVYTGKDWAARGFNAIAIRTQLNNVDGSSLVVPDRWPLAVDRVRHVGDAVAVIVAESPAAAIAAAEMVFVEYDTLPAAVCVEAAMADDAVLIHDERPQNLCMDWQTGDEEGCDSALSAAAHIVTCRVINNRVMANPMETRSIVAYPDGEGVTALTGSIQNVFVFRDLVANALNLETSAVRAYAEDIGGGFGAKNQIQPEHVLSVLASRDLDRPVKWVSGRSEGLMTDSHGRAIVTDIELGLDENYKFVGLRANSHADIGGYCSTNGPLIPTMATAAVFGGAYVIPNLYMRVKGYYTNTAPTDAYRGAGRPEAIYMLERVVEKAAKILGIDPIELREKNLIQPEQIPFKNALGRNIDCGNFPFVLRRAVEESGFENLSQRKSASLAAGKLRGWGVGFYMESTLGVPNEFAKLDLDQNGKAQITIGTQSAGMGHETVFAQIVADLLGVSVHDVAYKHADTAAMPQGGGHGGSRSLQIGGSALFRAGEVVAERLKKMAGDLLEAAPGDIEIEPGVLRIAGTDRVVSLKAVLEGMDEPISESSIYDRENFTYPYGCHVAEVEIDPETGRVNVDKYMVYDDFGRILNPMIVRGQIIGGIAQGIGQTLLEHVVFEEDSGQLLSGSFMDYTMPRADNIPDMENSIFFHEDDPSPSNPLGIKGCGEAGVIAAVPALVNAIHDALDGHSDIELDLPILPEAIWRAVNS